MSQVFIEIPILLLSLCVYPVKLSQIYAEYVADIEVEPSMIFFMLQLLLSTLWCIAATLTMQWLMLITTCNSLLCQICIVYFMYKTRQRHHQTTHHGFAKIPSQPMAAAAAAAAGSPQQPLISQPMGLLPAAQRLPTSSFCSQYGPS